MIPEAAVEAAAREFYGDAFGDVAGEELKYVLDQMRDTLEAAVPHVFAPVTGDAVEAAWSRVAHHFDDTEEESWKEEIRAALEAAAPHMMAEAWDEGEAAGQDNADSNRGHDIDYKRNPYRSQA